MISSRQHTIGAGISAIDLEDVAPLRGRGDLVARATGLYLRMKRLRLLDEQESQIKGVP